VGRYKSAAAQRREAQSRSAIIKIVVVALAFAGLLILYFQTVAGRRTLDPTTLCPASPDSVTVLLVDVTDPMNIAQRQDFINQLERLRNAIPRYGKLAIFKVSPAADQLLTPVIERCNPGTANDVSELTGDKEKTAKRWEEQFKAPLDQAFSQITAASGAPQSPILESIQSAALTELKTQQSDDKPHKLIVASDLLQNTPRMTFYGGRLSAPDATIASDGFRMLRTDLRGIDVELWMLQRPDSASSQPKALRDVWEAMIGAMGGNVVRIYNVSG